MPDLASVPAVSRRDRLLIATCLVLITVLAWAYLFHLAGSMASAMAGMETMVMPWSVSDGFFMFAMWAVMMVGMMAGTTMPVLLLYAGAQARRPRTSLAVPMFGLGYLAVWVGLSGFATLAQWVLHGATNPGLAGVILIGAGAYQWTPFKGACLNHCRSPLGFLMSNWRDGSFGALKMGSRHGMYCLGCCWALMCVLFVVGVMNLVWVAALTVLVFLEKTGPAGTIVARTAGAVMMVAGAFLVVRGIM